MASKYVSRDRFLPANARAVMSFMSCFKCGQAGHLMRDCQQKSNKGSCGPRGRAEECHPGTTSGTHEQGNSTETSCGVQRRNWIHAGNGPMCN